MGCSENWYDSYYAVCETFSEEELLKMEEKEIDTGFWEFIYYSDTGMEIGCEDKIFTSPNELISHHIKTLEENIEGIKANPYEGNKKYIIKNIQRSINAWKETEKEFANYNNMKNENQIFGMFGEISPYVLAKYLKKRLTVLNDLEYLSDFIEVEITENDYLRISFINSLYQEKIKYSNISEIEDINQFLYSVAYAIKEDIVEILAKILEDKENNNSN